MGKAAPISFFGGTAGENDNCVAGPGRRNVHEGIQKVDAPGQCRQNFSGCKAAELEQCVSVVGHPPGSGGPGGAAGGGQGGCASISIHAGELTPGAFLVLSGTGKIAACRASRRRMPPDSYDQSGAAHLCIAGFIL